MTREEAVRRIERATEEKLIELDLRGLELEELPSRGDNPVKTLIK
jgi:hypothetical protein